MNKKGQLGAIEMKFFFIGLLIGVIVTITLMILSSYNILPFTIPWVCG